MISRCSLSILLLVGLALIGAMQSHAHAKCRMKEPDVAVAGITLLDADSAVKIVGSGPQLSEGEEDLPHASFVSKDGAQELLLFIGPGAILDEYTEFEVREAGSEALVLKDLPVETFKTGRGVELGMTPAAVTGLFGTCTKAREKDGNTEIIQYELKAGELGGPLKSRGYELYFAEYEFVRGKLTRFRFGLEQP